MAERFIIDTSGTTGGGGIGDIDFDLSVNLAQSASGWIVHGTYIGNSGSLPVSVTSSLTVKQSNSGDTIFKVQDTSATDCFIIDNDGIPIVSSRENLPSIKAGGITYTNNEFYFGYS